MVDQRDPDDPKGLIREAYRIEGIGEGECRSVFLDWALSLPLDADPRAAIRRILDRPGLPGDHPMTVTLRAGLDPGTGPRRRGGRAGRGQG